MRRHCPLCGQRTDQIDRAVPLRANTPNELIDALGGNSPVDEALGVTGQAVSNWRVRGFPAWACSRLQQAADAASLQYDKDLFETRARGRAA